MNRSTLILIIAYFAFIAIGMFAGLLNIAWIYMEGTFRVAPEALGVLLTVGTTSRMVSSFLSGRILASMRVGMFLLIATMLVGLGILGYVFAPIWLALLAAALTASFGAGMIDAGLNTFVSVNYRTSHMNWLHAFFGVGLVFGPPVMTFVVVNLEQTWRLGYAMMILVFVVLAVSILLTRKDWRIGEDDLTDTGEGGASGRPTAGIWNSLKVPIVLLGLALFFTYGGVEIGTGQLTNILLVRGRDFDQATASSWVSMYWGTFTVGRMIMGAVVARISNILLMRITMSGAIIGAALLWLNPSEMTSFLGLALLGFSLAPMFPTLISETPRRVGIVHAANAIGFQVGVAGVGGALLPWLAVGLARSQGQEVIGLVITLTAVVIFILHEGILLREARKPSVLTASAD